MIPKKVRIVEVGPRDGLQNESKPVSTEVKLELIDRLADAGLRSIEATAFVSPKWVPQMADHSEVMSRLKRRPGVSYPVLVPNIKGFESALAVGVQEVAVFAAATETFSKRNTNCTIQESLERFAPIMDGAKKAGVKVRGYLSVVLGCPYEGEVPAERVAGLAGQLYEMGCYEISLGDSIGTGTARTTRELIEACAKRVPIEKLAGHFHDSYGQAVANIYASLELGLSTFDSSVSGLGGCPYAKGATGNVATEDVVYLLNGLAIDTGIDINRLADTGMWIAGVLGRSPSRAGKALVAKHEKAQAAA